MITKLKRSKKGFTLAELLIAIAIIAVLIAVALPVFTNQLNRAKHAVDVANVRSAYSQAVADYLLSQGTAGTPKTTTVDDLDDAVVNGSTVSLSGTTLTITFPSGSSNVASFEVDTDVVTG